MSDESAWKAAHLDLVARWAEDLAHEIKNPLHAMVINLELVKRRSHSDPESVVERARIVESELHRVHDLIDSLLRLVRPWPDRSGASVDEVFSMLLPAFAARAGVRKVGYEHEAGEASVAMSPGVLVQVLVHLIDRAIEGAPQGGILATRVEPEAGVVRITVIWGPEGEDGAPTEEASTDRSASSLAGVRRLVEAAGGSMEEQRFRDGGSFTLVLPRRGTA